MTREQLAAPATRFTPPPDTDAVAPPERRGIPRDGVRLLVARGPATSPRIEHCHFNDLPDLLEPGDLIVVNTSATLPAALDARMSDGRPVPVHVSTVLDDGDWVVGVGRAGGRGPHLGVEVGDRLGLPGRLSVRLGAAYPDRSATSSRLWRASVTPATDLQGYLARHGRPIEYAYLAGRFPLSDHQTVFATQPGSAEMASAARPFTTPLVVRLVARGVAVAPIVLHAGVSSPELPEPPTPERFDVPSATARLVASTRAAGGRVVAVGTTAVRALESAAASDGAVHPASGWTNLVMGPDRPARVVTGLVTGLHAPQASHLLLLEAVAGADLVAAAYTAAVEHRYLWHEFGDSTLFLP
jgi:S-adenosylmethionine:tRNA ribosyltransferase-isomerase